MKQLSQIAFVCALCGVSATGCGGSDGRTGHDSEQVGTLALPLVTNGPSGTQYRLRNATFDITGYSYYSYDYGNDAGVGAGGGSSTGPQQTVVSSEDNPNASSIEVNVQRGDYYIYLRDGWNLESVTNGVATPVQATLLSSQYQWIYVSPHSTSWVSYQFGIGDSSIWLNGKLNITIDVFENPDQYYGGDAGYPIAVGGAPAIY